MIMAISHNDKGFIPHGQVIYNHNIHTHIYRQHNCINNAAVLHNDIEGLFPRLYQLQ